MKKAFGVLFMIAATAGLVAQQKPRMIDDKALRDAVKSGDEWLTTGRDYAETHFSPLKQIDSTNVKRLGLAWSWETQAPAGSNVEAPALVANGVMYGSLGWDVMYAVDARTGQFKWRYDPEIPREVMRGICCTPSNRGVAMYNGRIYEGMLDGTLVAVDAETGKQAWRTKVTEKADTVLTSPVRVVKGKVIVGSSGADNAARGFFAAYDANTGKQVWRFYTVPGDPSKPFEHPELAMAAKTWTGEWWKMGGGGTVWDGMAYDEAADILYVGTGNGGPWNAAVRSPRGGDNLFLSSIIAVKPDTGRMVWYFQETPGETWDFTATQNIILADLRIGGKDRKVLLHAPKNGFFYVLDRITGEFISGQKYVQRMTWATGLDAKGRPIEAKGARWKDATVMTYPGVYGGHNWQPMSFSPLTKLVYVPGQERHSVYEPDPDYQYKPNANNTANKRGGAAFGTGPEPEGADKQPQITTDGFLLAWDPVTQKERWRVTSATVGGYTGGGTLVTGGNLMFHGNAAYDATTGEKLWQSDMADRSVTPISYMLDGKQYVSVIARTGPGARVFTFVLDGKEPMPPQPPAPPARGPVPPAAAPPAGNVHP
jgi:quinohemoprotein ethanol dehydrogenase